MLSFEAAQKLADAVLYEGYVLYPYRASAAKNRFRWQFGVAAPRAWSETGGCEGWAMQAECLLEPGAEAVLDLRLRCLQVEERAVEEALPGGGFRPVERLEVDGEPLVSWEEGVERVTDLAAVPVAGLLEGEREVAVDLEAGEEAEEVCDAAGRLRGRVVWRRRRVQGRWRIGAEAVGDLVKVRVQVENHTSWAGAAGAPRERALGRSMVGVHLLLAVRGGAFLSLTDPAPEAAEAAAGCRNSGVWPVLVGEAGRRDTVLAAPIILADYPEVAPESPGDFCDATEIDELLTLRVMTLTEEEKREARATDRRARGIVERSDALPPEWLQRLHGAVRDTPPAAPSPSPPSEASPAAAAGEGGLEAFAELLEADGPVEEDWIEVAGERVERGRRVRLRPSRRADAQDMFLAGRSAVVEGVWRDIEDRVYVAVNLDDDPAGDLHSWYGRYLFFYPEEIEPLDSGAGSPDAARVRRRRTGPAREPGAGRRRG